MTNEERRKSAEWFRNRSKNCPIMEEDYTELRDRFGEYVEFVVRDMITGKGERWRR